MIFDKLTNIELYGNLNANFKKAAEFLVTTDLTALPVGKAEIDGDKVFAKISEYQTKNYEDAKSETHKKYADIQIILSGEEIMYYVNKSETTENCDYNEVKDIVFCDAKNEVPLIVKAGYFAIFFPQDAHRPNCKVNDNSAVKKLLIKVAL